MIPSDERMHELWIETQLLDGFRRKHSVLLSRHPKAWFKAVVVR